MGVPVVAAGSGCPKDTVTWALVTKVSQRPLRASTRPGRPSGSFPPSSHSPSAVSAAGDGPWEPGPRASSRMRTPAATCGHLLPCRWGLGPPRTQQRGGDRGCLAGEEAAAPGSRAEWGRAFRTHGTRAEVLGPPEGWTVLGELEGGLWPGWGGGAPTRGTQQGTAGTQHHISLICPRDLSSPPGANSGTPPLARASSGRSARPPGFQNVRESRVPRVPLPQAGPALAPQHPPEGLLYPVAHFADGEPEAPVQSHTAGARRVLAWGQAFPLKDWPPRVALRGQLAPCDPLAPPACPRVPPLAAPRPLAGSVCEPVRWPPGPARQRWS